jgi:hypothetical protein
MLRLRRFAIANSMINPRFGIVMPALVGLGLFVMHSTVPADDAPLPKTLVPAQELLDVRATAGRLDRWVAIRQKAAQVEPAACADDAAFQRRLYLDLIGRIPSVSEARAFLDDARPDKRTRLVRELLDSPSFVNHFADVWRAWLLPENGNTQAEQLAPGFEAWLRTKLKTRTGYDKMVREMLLAAPTRGNRLGALGEVQSGGAEAFAQANEFKPENLAGSTARLFLGIKLECAQCHDHPTARWSREQFWQFAAFFSAQGRKREVKIPNTSQSVTPRFLDNTEPQLANNSNARAVLADWMLAPSNPYFARATVNRLWAYFFGIGLVDPVDDLSEQNPASHPELLDELAEQFAAHQFDLRYLIEVMVTSGTYELSSVVTHEGQADPRIFARMPVRGLSPEQLFDSLALATGYQPPPVSGPRAARAANVRAEFLAKFAHANERRTETQTSMLQALALMNGHLTADATSLDRSEILAAVADAPFLSNAECIEALYLATLSRKPRGEEAARFTAYVEAGGPHHDRRRALADVFWALLNSSEFIMNH